MEYQLVAETHSYRMDEKVKELCAEGWIPHGIPTVSACGRKTKSFCQTMIHKSVKGDSQSVNKKSAEHLCACGSSNVMYKIEKRIPAPLASVKIGEVVETIKKMAIGDSVKLENKKQLQAWREIAQRNGYKLATRTKPEFRVWLVSNPYHEAKQ